MIPVRPRPPLTITCRTAHQIHHQGTNSRRHVAAVQTTRETTPQMIERAKRGPRNDAKHRHNALTPRDLTQPPESPQSPLHQCPVTRPVPGDGQSARKLAPHTSTNVQAPPLPAP